MPIPKKSQKGGPRSQKKLATSVHIQDGLLESIRSLVEKVNIRKVSPEERFDITETRAQRDIILAENEETMLDLIKARSWEFRKWILFFFGLISSLVGVVICLAAEGQTVLFAENSKSGILLGIGCIFFVPCLYWVKVMILPHRAEKEAREDMIGKRTTRRYEAKMRRLWLDGRLPRPEKEMENELLPYEYNPDEPWMYVRWKPKPKLRVWYDDEGVAHKVDPGSKQEAVLIAQEEEMQRILTGVMSGQKRGELQSDAGTTSLNSEGGKSGKNVEDVEMGRKSSAGL